jgi:transposase
MAEQGRLPEMPESMAPPAESAPLEIRGERKLIPINRQQTMLAMIDVEELIGPDHKARAIWELTGRLKLEEWEEGIRTSQGEVGRAAWDPRLLISVWVYGYSEKITSARELERVMEHEPGLQWLTGLKSINHHTLSDFRVSRQKQMDKLFVDLLTVMQEAKLLNLDLVMHDGTKIRAQAGADSFRREETVRERLEQTRALVQTDPREPAGRSRREAAQQRTRREMEQRLSQAAEELEKIRGGRDENEKRPARVSVSEPEARRMKHGDNAIAPSYNLQLSTDAAHGVIVGVDLNQHSDDSHGLKPAMDEVKKNLGRDPQCVVADGGYTNRQTIEEMEERKLEFIGSPCDPRERSEAAMKSVGIDPRYAPHFFIFQEESDTLLCPEGKTLKYVRQSRKRDQRYRQYQAEGSACASCVRQKQCCPRSPWKGRTVSRREQEHEVVVKFREKMNTEAAQQIYRKRGAVAEFPFAWIKERFGLRKFRVRGLAKARMEAKWACLVHNAMIWIRLCWPTRKTNPAIIVAA